MLQTLTPSCPIFWPPKPSRPVMPLCPRPGQPQQGPRDHDPSSLHVPRATPLSQGRASPQVTPELHLMRARLSCLGAGTRGKGPDRGLGRRVPSLFCHTATRAGARAQGTALRTMPRGKGVKGAAEGTEGAPDHQHTYLKRLPGEHCLKDTTEDRTPKMGGRHGDRGTKI